MRIEDIAEIANVSKSAVSLALNNKPGVSDETRQQILEIVEKYNYVPLRKTKHTKHTKQGLIKFIACKSENIITDDYENQPFFNELIGYLTEEIKSTKYSLLISSITVDEINKEITSLEQEQDTKAIILLGTNITKQNMRQIEKIKKTIIIIDTCYPEINLDFISINNFQGGYQAGKYLIKQGHRNIGYAQSSSRIYNFNQRKKGFLAALAEKNVEILNENFFEFEPMLISVNPKLQNEYFTHSNKPTAIFCENDYIAISLIKTLDLLGISVPQDVSIVGFDNIPESKVISPELTTIQVDKKEIVKESLRKVIESLENDNHTKFQTFIGTSLVERNSSISI